ncbi:SS18-like protein 2 isoform X2 [Octodon degus]|uniref:SS18-like protein 2 isoform X2 n=1 Tax=Octodon degus TaxID=10160 RepID=A0A6P6D8H8_OCTDE|nr:SS18-like protein 2 isoform X2 [Octodon degus]
MSVAFVPYWMRGKAVVDQETIQRLLEENDQLIRCIVEYQNKGCANECVHCEPHTSTNKGCPKQVEGISRCYIETSFT